MRPALPLLAVVVATLCGCRADGTSPASSAGNAPAVAAVQRGPMSVRGLHCWVPSRDQVDACEAFIRDVLPREGVNTLILQFHYCYQFKSRPEIGGGSALGRDEVRRLVRACRESGVRLIPQLNCLGHQGMPWAPAARTLLQAHPEFDEAPHLPKGIRGQKGVECYCPRHPDLHPILFDLIDELAEVCQADAFHVGMDEVFNIADPKCPRCAGADPAVLFAEEVNRLHAHLKSRGLEMWMWGDRLLDAATAGTNTWESSDNGTFPAVDKIPTDIVICDWHYTVAPPTPRTFVDKGFRVVACPWQRSDIALAQLAMMRRLADDPDATRAARAFGMVQTTWTSLYRFAQAYGQADAQPANDRVKCFRTLMAAMKTPDS